jgi:hypothetical protein
MDGATLRVRCVCGWETVGTEDEVIPATQEHGRRVHNMAATRDEVLVMATPVAEPDVAGQLRVEDNPAESRYEVSLDGRVVGVSEYELEGDRIVFVHTEVDQSVEGLGIGGRLAAGALDDVRRRGLRLAVECPFIAAWLRRHRDYADLLAG